MQVLQGASIPRLFSKNANIVPLRNDNRIFNSCFYSTTENTVSQNFANCCCHPTVQKIMTWHTAWLQHSCKGSWSALECHCHEITYPPHKMWSPFRYSVFRLIRPDQSERVEQSPLMQTYPPWIIRNYPLWKVIPLEPNCLLLKDNWQPLK